MSNVQRSCSGGHIEGLSFFETNRLSKYQKLMSLESVFVFERQNTLGSLLHIKRKKENIDHEIRSQYVESPNSPRQQKIVRKN